MGKKKHKKFCLATLVFFYTQLLLQNFATIISFLSLQLIVRACRLHVTVMETMTKKKKNERIYGKNIKCLSTQIISSRFVAFFPLYICIVHTHTHMRTQRIKCPQKKTFDEHKRNNVITDSHEILKSCVYVPFNTGSVFYTTNSASY